MKLIRDEAHLLLAAIRLRHYLLERSPTPAEVADLLDRSETEIRLQLGCLEQLGAVGLVDSAFETHVEITDYLQVEELSTESGPALSDALAAFKKRQEEEATRLAQLFDSGEAAQKHQDNVERMDEELARFRREKPANPFGDD